MTDAERDRNHERWLTKVGEDQQQLQKLITSGKLSVTRQLIMLWTLDRSRFESLQQLLNSLPPGAMQEFALYWFSYSTDAYCRDPPADDALLATATELARLARSLGSLTRLYLLHTPHSIATSILATCSGLECASNSSPLVRANVRSPFSTTQTLRYLSLDNIVFESTESINTFCRVITTSSLEKVTLSKVFFLRQQHEEQVSTTLAACNTLTHFAYPDGASSSFCDHFCQTLSDNFDTKLVHLWLEYGSGPFKRQMVLKGDVGFSTTAVDAEIENKIRYLLKLNVQRQTCPPLFEAIGMAETDANRKQCLVKAFEAVDIPVVVEYITANQSNMIELIQRLGRSRKRERED